MGGAYTSDVSICLHYFMGKKRKKNFPPVKMLPQMMSRPLSGSRGLVRQSVTRNFGATAVAMKELDPIQALFVEKIKEYTKASAEAGDDLLGASDEIRAKLAGEYEKIARMYGAESGGMEEFPTFPFEEPLLDSLATELVEGDLKAALTS